MHDEEGARGAAREVAPTTPDGDSWWQLSSDYRVRLLRPWVPEAAGDAVARTLSSGWLGEGPRVEELESRLASVMKVPSVVALNSGTSALELAYHLAGLGPGDEVISTPMTCAATNIALLRRGVEICWADVDPRTGNLDPQHLRDCLSSRTRAVVAVHWGGLPCAMDAIMDFAREHELVVIEDAAHALGSEYEGRPIGGHGDFVCFSFQAVKTLTTGDGGALVCRDPEMDLSARRLRWHGIDRRARDPRDPLRFDIAEAGYKFQMNDIAATLGLAGLDSLDENLARRRDNARFYDQALAALPHLEPCPVVAGASSAYWLYTILLDDRDRWIERLRQGDVEASRVHDRNDRFALFSGARRGSELRGLRAFAERMLCIPLGPWLRPEDRELVAELLAPMGC